MIIVEHDANVRHAFIVTLREACSMTSYVCLAFKHQCICLFNFILDMVWPILAYTFSVTDAFICFRILVVAYTLSTGTCGSGLLVPMNTGVFAK